MVGAEGGTRGRQHGLLGDTVLITVVGLLEAALNGDDSIRARHLQLQVGVVGDNHELSKAWPSEESVVEAEKVHQLEGE